MDSVPFLDVLAGTLLDPGGIEEALDRAVRELAAPAVGSSEAHRVELATVNGELKNLIVAVAHGLDLATLKPAIDARRGEAARLERLIAQEAARQKAMQVSPTLLREKLKAVLHDWQATLSRHAPETRLVMPRLIEGRLELTPRADERGEFYEFQGMGTIEPVLAGILPQTWRPQRDSNPCFSLERAAS
jgi:hypothetical protein